MAVSVSPLRDVSDAERADYDRDGAVVLRGILPGDWIDQTRLAIDRCVDAPSEAAMSLGSTERRGRYLGDFFLWRRDPDFRSLALHSPLAEIAQQILHSSRVDFFYDQLLVKEPATPDETPWHQDLPYWPLKGADILSLWVAFDSVTVESGAMHYVKGSHRRGVMYAPTAFNKGGAFASVYDKAGLPPFPPIDRAALADDILVCPVEPGDIIVHHPLTFHWSPGNLHEERRRRAVALRYLGDDAVYDDRPGTFFDNPKIVALLDAQVDKTPGKRLGGANFPRVWPRTETTV